MSPKYQEPQKPKHVSFDNDCFLADGKRFKGNQKPEQENCGDMVELARIRKTVEDCQKSYQDLLKKRQRRQTDANCRIDELIDQLQEEF
jgi:hypothetical protein